MELWFNDFQNSISLLVILEIIPGGDHAWPAWMRPTGHSSQQSMETEWAPPAYSWSQGVCWALPCCCCCCFALARISRVAHSLGIPYFLRTRASSAQFARYTLAEHAPTTIYERNPYFFSNLFPTFMRYLITNIHKGPRRWFEMETHGTRSCICYVSCLFVF